MKLCSTKFMQDALGTYKIQHCLWFIPP